MASAKLILAVVDGCKPAMLERAIAAGEAPVMAEIATRGTYVAECCAAFPSVTPVCATAIATGVLQDRHLIPGMNWYHRGERRYVEYGSSLRAARRLGIQRQLADLMYNMNAEHLAADVETVYESLDDVGVRTAGTTFLIYRGRHEHATARDTAVTRLASTVLKRTVMGPRELFYADIFASRDTGCRSQLGLPGVRDKHAGCVGAWLAARDLFDFLLLSLPDTDTHSHKNGPHAQTASIAQADLQLARIAQACGGLDRFLSTHAVIVVADHSHAPVERAVALTEAFGDWGVAGPGGVTMDEAEIALCPNQRAAMVYALVAAGRDALVPRIVAQCAALDGVELIAWRAGRSVVIRGAGDTRLSFAPLSPASRSARAVRDARGGRWRVEGDLGALRAQVSDGSFESRDFPDALRRVWAAFACPTSGDVLLSAAPGWEFPDWGGVTHIGAGSHGSLHRSDSLGALLFCGIEPPPGHPGAWSITDPAAMIRTHFGAT